MRKRGALYNVAGHTKLVSHVQFDPIGGHYLLTGSYDGTCKIWSSGTWQLRKCLAGNTGPVMSADIARDTGAVVTVSLEKKLTLWRTDREDAEQPDDEQVMDTSH